MAYRDSEGERQRSGGVKQGQAKREKKERKFNFLKKKSWQRQRHRKKKLERGACRLRHMFDKALFVSFLFGV